METTLGNHGNEIGLYGHYGDLICVMTNFELFMKCQ